MVDPGWDPGWLWLLPIVLGIAIIVIVLIYAIGRPRRAAPPPRDDYGSGAEPADQSYAGAKPRRPEQPPFPDIPKPPRHVP